jgi:putative transposase
MHLTYKYRVYPTQQQANQLDGMLGAFCDLYNAGLQQRIEAYQRQHVTLTCITQCNELKACREADERLASFGFSTEQQVMRRLDKAFKAFFGRLKKTGKAGFPRFQKKTRYDSAEFRIGDGLTIKKSDKLGVVGISGEIRVKWHRTLPTTATSAVLTRNNGKWYICFQVKLPDVEIQEPVNPVGIDVGLHQLMALSDGVSFDNPRYSRQSQAKQRRLQRSLSRCKRNSKGRNKARIRLARHSAHVANQRRDHAHKLTTDLTRSYDGFAFEHLQIKNMIKSNLAKSIHDAAWTQITSFITYKAASAGMRCVAVDPRGTSQNCSVCGGIPLVKKPLSVRTHRCEDCGLVMDRDVNAARNILQRSRLGISPKTPTGGASKLVVLEAAPFRGR